MKLLTIGDSYTYGDELKDRSFAWPYILAKKMGWAVTNLGINSASNNAMIRRAVEQIDQHDIVIIGWTHSDRIELADEGGSYETWPAKRNVPDVDRYPWRREFALYYTLYHNHAYAYRQYLINVILFQSLAQLKNKRYLMLDSFGNNLNRDENKDVCSDLIAQIDKEHYVGWPSESMVTIAGDAPLARGVTGHFLELGHQRVAERLSNEIAKHTWY